MGDLLVWLQELSGKGLPARLPVPLCLGDSDALFSSWAAAHVALGTFMRLWPHSSHPRSCVSALMRQMWLLNQRQMGTLALLCH